jgi:hypothetical protein
MHALLTNRRPKWLEELKDTLQEDATREGLDGWEHIGTGRDLRLTGEQKHNSQAVDIVMHRLCVCALTKYPCKGY